MKTYESYTKEKKNAIITDNKGNKYILLAPVVGENYLVPYDGRKHWEHHFVPKETWIPMKEVDFDDFDITEEEYNNILIEDKKGFEKILKKYHDSF